MTIGEMKKNDRGTFNLLCMAIEEREAKNGSLFCVVTLSDKDTSVTAKLWNNAKEKVAEMEGKVIEADVICKEFNGTLDYELAHYKITDLPVEDYVKTAPYNTAGLYEKVIQVLDSYPDNGYTLLAKEIYRDNKDRLIKWGAAKNVHHNYMGGLIWHISRMVFSAKYLASLYNLNAPLLVAAAALHDIGKLKELETNTIGSSEYTNTGVLLGHTYIGMKMIEDAAHNYFKPNLSTEEIDEFIEPLIHCIAAHHGNLEWGAITLPCTKEAEILHHIDMIDSRMEIYDAELEKLEEGEMSGRIFATGNSIYKMNSKELRELNDKIMCVRG